MAYRISHEVRHPRGEVARDAMPSSRCPELTTHPAHVHIGHGDGLFTRDSPSAANAASAFVARF